MTLLALVDEMTEHLFDLAAPRELHVVDCETVRRRPMEEIDAKTKRSWRGLGWSVAEQVTAVAAGRYTRAINARVFRAHEGAT
jgi:hypothetical protein